MGLELMKRSHFILGFCIYSSGTRSINTAILEMHLPWSGYYLEHCGDARLELVVYGCFNVRFYRGHIDTLVIPGHWGPDV